MNIISLLGYLKYYYSGGFAWLNEVYDVLPFILYSILAVVGAAGAVYSIVLGVNLAKSENDEKRKAAISRLRNTIIGIAVLLVLVLIINLGIPAILRAAFPEYVLDAEPTPVDPDAGENAGGGGSGAQALVLMFNTAKYLFHPN